MTFDWTVSWPVVLTLALGLGGLGLGLLRLHRCFERRLTTVETAMDERHAANLLRLEGLTDQIAAVLAALLGRDR